MHADYFIGILDADIQLLNIELCQLRFNRRSFTDQHNRNLPSPGSHDSTGNFMRRSIVSSHDINSDNGAVIQEEMPLLFCTENVLALVSATGRTGAVSLFRLLALRADRDTRGFQAIVGAAHVAFGF